ncbi:hypothetical protein I6F21_35255 [Bradyrhizobium sp. NBAIM03]|uniref:hypothetical protein n=1 Tax=Bradyrhizobium sp. NBAIM03 TaxID=2793816 RepID=UPI001CD562E9|nr:hypothetical protein [Bradyrhizobium sp. NBAIM03]MCA1537774.1 hypothetical protein [Bradyrhizobium sp. NBAIM03]
MLATISRGSSVKPPLVDRIQLWLSKGRMIDGLWIGTLSDDPELALQRVEAALRLIERSAPLHYQRVKKSLSRIWVQLVPHGAGCYQHSLNACLLDPRVVASETTTIEWIASAIVHEATHARLENWGIRYDEAARSRIERICARRELDFALHLTDVDALHEEIAQRLDLCRDEGTYYSDENMRLTMEQGSVEALRHLGTPEWAIALVFRVIGLRHAFHRFTRRLAGVLAR